MTAKESEQVKGIAILMMLFHHLFSYNRIKYVPLMAYMLPGNNTVEAFCALACKITVTVFLCLGGYGFACKYSNAAVQKKDIQKNSFRSIKKIYIKYWVSLLFFLPYGFITNCFNIKGELLKNIFAYKTTYNGECWFVLPYVLNILITIPLLLKLESKKCPLQKIVFMSVFVNFTAYGMRFMLGKSSISEVMNTSVYFNLYYFMLTQFPFVLGWVCKRVGFFEILKNKPIGPLKYIGLLIALMFIKVYGKGGMFLDSVLTPLCIVLVIKVLNKSKIIDGCLGKLGRRSTYMWLTHSYFCFYYFKDIFEKIGNPILMFIVLVSISYVVSIILEKVEFKTKKLYFVENKKL